MFCQSIFQGFFISMNILNLQAQFAILKFLAIHDVLDIEFFGAFYGL
jgi:hypothetical protein